MPYRQPYDGDRLAFVDVPAATWLRLSFAISAAAAVIVVIAWLAFDQTLDFYDPDGRPIIEALAAGLTYGLWIMALNMAAAVLAFTALAAWRRIRRPSPRA
ncbi:hypothetical protein [Sphingomonas mesophila]|uniref:hypothetical protein n=1 Tax=Sphingomonas mesophila TaxID=2303576 RepID=UPI000E579807|nr:hypothetical protein [Sphingomonas mesophila]